MKNWEMRVIRWGFGLTSASGVVYGVMKYFLQSSNPDSRVGHPWQPASLAVHVLAAPVAVFCMGILLRGHVIPRWRAGDREGRATGVLLIAIGLPLVLSGYLVQVLTGDTARRATGWLHAGVGVVFALAFLLHMPASRPPNDAPEAPAEPQDGVS